MNAGSARTAWDIDIRGLSFGYPGAQRPAISDVSILVAAGEHVAIVGPNGAGKSTLLLHLNGILEPSTGTLSIGGLGVVPDNLPEIRRRVGLVFQDPDDQLFMPTLLEDVAFGPLCHGAGNAEAEVLAREALESVGLSQVDAHRPAHHLSGGEKRRAALATVLSMDPGVLALDEPSAALDGRGRRQVASILRARHQTLLVVTHDVEFAAAICSRTILIDDGQLVFDGHTSELLDDAKLLVAHGLELTAWLHRPV